MPLAAESLATLTGLPPGGGALATALALAQEARLIRPMGDLDRPLRQVDSAVVRHVLLRTLSEQELQEVHGRLAAHLEATAAPMAEIAYHAVRAADRARAARTAAVTGRHFLELRDHARAREYLEATVAFEEDPARRARAAVDWRRLRGHPLLDRPGTGFCWHHHVANRPGA